MGSCLRATNIGLVEMTVAVQSGVLISLPIIRNKAATHGSGATGREMSGSMANLAVNLACALETHLIQETTDKE